MVTPSKHPPAYEQLLPLPTPCFNMFLERSLDDPNHPPPHFKHLSLLLPSPSNTPSPLKSLIIHERTLVKNLGRNIIRKLVVKLEGNEIITIDDYGILYSYYDCWKSTIERPNAVFQGIIEVGGQTENAIKHRINTKTKEDVANDKTVESIFNFKFCIPLDFEILESGLPFYQYGLGSRLTYELTFADYSDVIKSTNDDASYTISNISLEFDTVTNAPLASQFGTEYMKAAFYMTEFLDLV